MMKLSNLVFVSLALLTLATAITPQVRAEGPPVHAYSDLAIVIKNHGFRAISGMMGVCGSDVYTQDGWELGCKYMDWQSFIVNGGQSVTFAYNFPNGKYTVNVAWTFNFYGETRGIVEERSFRNVDLNSDSTVILNIA